jgi:threonyl-tRNA synthetase
VRGDDCAAVLTGRTKPHYLGAINKVTVDGTEYDNAEPVIIAPDGTIDLAAKKDGKEVFANAGIRVELDSRDEKLSYRMRDAQLHKIPYNLIIGDKERDNNEVSYRKFGSEETVTMNLDEFVALLKEEIESKKLNK